MTIARDFGDLADMIRERLAAIVTEAKSVEPYAGQVEDALGSPVARFPFLTVLYTGTTFEAADGVIYREVNEYELGLFVQSLKGAADLKSKADELIRSTRDALVNVRLADNSEHTVPMATRLVLASDTVQVYGFGVSAALDNSYPLTEA